MSPISPRPKYKPDTRTEAQKLQNNLFLFLGTLARTSASLRNISQSKHIYILDLERAKIAGTLHILAGMEQAVRDSMSNLPKKSKSKSKSKSITAEAKLKAEKSND